MSTIATKFPNEPAEPYMVSETFPGPEAKKIIAGISKVQCTMTTDFPVDLEKCTGNYLADVDGNMFLDTVQSISSRALGYNMPEMHEVARSDEMAYYLSNRTALGLYPPKNWANLL